MSIRFRDPIDIQQALRTLSHAVDQHAGMLNQHQAFIARETAKQMLQAEKDILSHAIDKGQAYTRAMLFGGYAGFFTFWIFMKDKMGDIPFVSSGLLMAVSLTIFICYSIWQNVSMNGVFLQRAGLIHENADDPMKYLKAKEAAHDEKIKEWYSKNVKSWYVVVLVTVVPGLLAISILLYAFVSFLLSEVDWNAIRAAWFS